MRAVAQRVIRGWVRIDDREVAAIGPGLVILLGVGQDDAEADASYIANKILNLRVFPDHEGWFNFSVLDARGELLVVSQFTLFGDCRKGRRPSFSGAARPENALGLYQSLVGHLAESGLRVVTGEFQAMMSVGIVNDGPVTILIDSKKAF
ncbi:MAG: D-aminoacyl-tRNA deacylase [Thermacetogeniaceae bacterium]